MPTYQEAWQVKPQAEVIAVTSVAINLTLDLEYGWDGAAEIYFGQELLDKKVFCTQARNCAELDEAIATVIGEVVTTNNLQRVWLGASE